METTPNSLRSSLLRTCLVIFTILLILFAGRSNLRAATFTTIANGNWSSPATWMGGSVPPSTIPVADIVNIGHVVTYNLSNDLEVFGVVNIINGTFQTPFVSGNGFGRSVFIRSGGDWNMCNANMFLPIFSCGYGCLTGTNLSGNFINEGGSIVIFNSTLEIAQNWQDNSTAGGGSRTFSGGCLKIGEDFSNKGAIDLYDASCIELGLHGSGNWLNEYRQTFQNSTTIRLKGTGSSGNVKNTAGSPNGVLGGPGPIDILALGLPGNLDNDGAWSAQVLDFCIGGSVGGSQAADFTADVTNNDTPAACAAVNATECTTCPAGVCMLEVTVMSTPVTCEGNGSDGTATATVTPGTETQTCTGGGSAITYIWNTIPPQMTQTAINLPPGTYTVTVTDAAGCTATASVTLTIPDCGELTITCPPDLVMECDEGSDYVSQINVWIATAMPVGDCPPITVTDDYDDISVPPLSCNLSTGLVVTFTATDDCGNTATCTATAYLDDTVPPSITCPTVTSPIECPASPTFPPATASDLCDATVTITFVDVTTPSGICPQEYSVTRTWTATDDCSNSSTCSRTIAVTDNTVPVITCPTVVTSVECPAIPTFPPATASDLCDATVTITFVDVTTPSGICPQEYSVTRTWTATDDCLNSSTCSRTIAVTDNTPPMIICPIVPAFVQCPVGPSFPPAMAIDLCDATVSITFVDVTTPSGICAQEYSLTRTWTATDDCGNSSTCSRTTSVMDDTAPVITCPTTPASIECPATPSFPPATATDLCDATVTITFVDVTTPSGICPQEYSVTRTWTASDDCGNSSTCSRTIAVTDNTSPVITCPTVTTSIECPATPSFPPATASDLCDATVTITFADVTIPSGICPQEYSVRRTWTATDDCGNSSTCSRTISVTDNTPPVIACPTVISPVECPATPSFPPATASDVCDASVIITFADVTIPSGICPQEYSVRRTWTATDDCGNSSTCSRTIAVTDNTAPVITCPTIVTPVECPATPTFPPATATDICDASVTITFVNVTTPSGICPQEYSVTRTWTATDDCGNSSTCSRTIAVTDNTPPVITCPTVPASVECPVAPSFPAATATDLCDATVSITFIDVTTPSGTCPQEYSVTRTWTATDDCSNSSTCSRTFAVTDNTPPMIVCPPDMTISNEDDTSPQNTGTPTVSDACDATPTLTSSDLTIEGDCQGDYEIRRTWMATDDCNNTSTCTQTIVVDGPCNVDLALVKDLNPGQNPISGGDDVDFTITVSNEGFLSAGSITVTDYIPIGFTLNDPDWTAGTSGSTGQSASIILSIGNGALPPGGLIPGADVTVEITLQADANIGPGVYTNIAEITTVLDVDGNDVSNEDVDSDPDDDDTNDPDAEDDHDPAALCIITDVIILGNDFVCTGDTVTYTVQDYNSTYTYMWLLSGGGIIIENNDSSIVVVWTAPPGGPFTISVNQISAPDCQSSGSLDVFIQGGEAIACLDHVNLSIDNECGTVVLSGMILTGDQAGNNSFLVYVIDMNGDTVPNATLTWMHVGQTFKVSVVSLCSGQSCWAFLTVEDKLPPQINCICPVGNEDEICEISCLQIDEFLNGNIPLELRPTAVDNCGGTTLEIINIELSYETCSNGFILVTWQATDAGGNTSTCVQQFNIIPLTLETLVFPPDFFGDCDDSSDPSNTGWPQVDGFDLSNIPGHCNIMATYTDNEFDMCGGGRKIIRTWRVFDWCVPVMVEFVQFIILADQEGPVLTCPLDMVVGTEVWYCYANVFVPKPIAIDACSAIKSFHLFSPAGTVVPVGNNFKINNLPIGMHTVIWTVTDECHNTSTCSVDITVIDDVPPVVACKQHLIVSLTNDRPNGITLVPADAFDDGSFDNCTPVGFRARRMDSCIDFDWTTGGACVDDIPGGIPAVNDKDRGTDLGICVPFGCCDVGAGPIMVELEVTDDAGNVNYCMVEIEVQDKISPFVICPPDIHVSCEFAFIVEEGLFIDAQGNNNGSLDEDPLSELFGNVFDAFRHDASVRQPIIINDPDNEAFPQPFNWGIDGWATDNCEVNLQVNVVVFDDCSGNSLPGDAPPGAVRLIRRIFSASDATGNITPSICYQDIWVVDYDPFFITDTTCNNENPFDGVIWPCDVLLNTCPDELNGTGEPVILDDECSLVGVTFEDARFDFADGTCYKVRREWIVIDWCQFDVNTGYGLWTYVQTIKVLDNVGPVFLTCPQAPVELCLDDPGITLPANNQTNLGENNPNASSCSVHVAMTQRVRELCSGSVIYDVKLYPFNGNEFIQIKPETILPLNANNEGDLSFNTQQSSIPSIAEDGLPYNNALCGDYHRVLWTVEDGCGNRNFCEYLFRLEDCKDPTPVCIKGLSSVVMPAEGEVTIWASDFNASSFDDCTPSEELLYSFSGTEYEPSFTYTCDNVPEFGVPIIEEIWAADGGSDQNCNGQIEWSERNKDFCTTYIIITDNDGVCEGGGIQLTGEILTEHTDAVSNVMVHLNSPGISPPGYLTSTEGKFTFDDLPLGLDYTIKPERADDHKNGVSTLDLVVIQKHLLGKELFDSPYQYIAADANNSHGVSAIDLIEIRKLILGLYPAFPSNLSWRFVQKDFNVVQGNPWPFPETIEIQDLSPTSVGNIDFIGVKIGDVNNTVKANAMQIVPRNGGRVMDVKALINGEMRPGEVIEVRMILPEIIKGFQWTLETNGLEYIGVKSRDILIDESNVGVLGIGMVTMSWNGDPVIEESNQQELSLIMEFTVLEKGQIEQMISMTGSITKAEAYALSGEILQPDLQFDQSRMFTDFALYQNKPNPWNGHTLIGFDLPADGMASLIVYDVAGKIVKTVTGEYKAGYNAIMLTHKDIPTPGILYYRLESGEYSATKKMLIF